MKNKIGSIILSHEVIKKNRSTIPLQKNSWDLMCFETQNFSDLRKLQISHVTTPGMAGGGMVVAFNHAH